MKKIHVTALSFTIAASSLCAVLIPGPRHSAAAAESNVSLTKDVMPIFQAHCTACHTPGAEGTTASGLDLTSYQGVMKGTKYGPMVIAGNPDYSNLMWLLDWKASPRLRMPHGKEQLPAKERDTVRLWIRQGAKDN